MRVAVLAALLIGVGADGAGAMSAAEGALAQLRAVWPTDSYANVGVTPMIGISDTAVEVFTMKNAKTLVKFARTKGLGRLAFRSLNRDEKCRPLAQSARDDCSGVAQAPGASAKALVASN